MKRFLLRFFDVLATLSSFVMMFFVFFCLAYLKVNIHFFKILIPIIIASGVFVIPVLKRRIFVRLADRVRDNVKRGGQIDFNKDFFRDLDAICKYTSKQGEIIYNTVRQCSCTHTIHTWECRDRSFRRGRSHSPLGSISIVCEESTGKIVDARCYIKEYGRMDW